jgi:predicted DNA-binding protein (UPF0251 family)
MGRDPTEQATPDLFPTDTVRDAPATPTNPIAAKETAASPQRHILPKNLRHAVTQLSDSELDELFEVTLDEAKRRGRLPPDLRTDSTPPSGFRAAKADVPEVSLTRGQMNAVRAAFKAGLTPSRIARQFGISQSNVRKALASDEPKR